MTMRDVLSTPPILYDNHSLNRQYRLTALAWSIPNKRLETIEVVSLLMQHVLSVDYVHRKIFFNGNKAKKALAKISSQLANRSLELNGEEEPFEQYLVKSLAYGRKWEQIICEHKLDKIFTEIKYKWQIRQYWIAYICWSSFKWKEAVYLAFKLLSRSKDAFQIQLGKVKSVDYYREKLHVWLTKDTSLIEKLEDDQVRQLLLSVKQKHDMVTTLGNQKQPHLNLNHSEKHLYNLWLPFLCLKYPTNYQKEYFDICPQHKTISWQQNWSNEFMNVQAYGKLEKKLQRLFQTVQILSDLFFDEIEVLLLEGIRDQIDWKIVKASISAPFNYKSKVGQMSKYISQMEANEDESVWKDLHSRLREQSIRKSNSMMSKSQMSCLKENLVRISEKFQQEDDKEYEEDSFTSKSKCLNDETTIERFYESSRGSIIDQLGRSIGKTQDTSVKNDTQGSVKDFALNQQQKLMLSLLQMGREYMKQVQQEYFVSVPEAELQRFARDSKNQILPLAYTELNYYRMFPEKLFLIRNPLIKSLIKILLSADSIIPRQRSIKNERLEDDDWVQNKENESVFPEQFSDEFQKNTKKFKIPSHLLEILPLQEGIKEEVYENQ